MAAAKAAARGHSAPRPPDPLDTLYREGQAMREKFSVERRAAIEATAVLTRKTTEYLRDKPPEVQAAFVKGMVQEGRLIFQPWAMEILYVVGLLGRARFTELQRLLGVSSRVLSDKIQALREGGLLEREVFDEHPVRIEYALTRGGQRVVIMGSPLFCELDYAIALTRQTAGSREGTAADRPPARSDRPSAKRA